jgi:cysteine desulfurase
MDGMRPFYLESFGNPHSSEHIFGWKASKAVEVARKKISALINADPDEIIFTSGATEANNLCIFGSVKRIQNNRSTILISAIEHKCILNISQALKGQYGMTIKVIPVDSQGLINLEKLEKELNDDVALVSIMAVNNEIGTIEPLREAGQLIRKAGALFHCDAAQALCAIDIDVDLLGIDLLSLSAHKIYGPKGIGAAYIRRELQHNIEPTIYGGGQEHGLRGGSLPTTLCVGMGVAADLLHAATRGIERTQIASLRDYFVTRLSEVAVLNGPINKYRHPGNANLCFRGVNSQDLLATLQPNLAASSGSACTSGIVEPSYVLREIGLNVEEAESSVRFSLGRFTTKQDVEEAISLIFQALDELK